MTIRGHFIGDAPYFSVYLRSAQFEGIVWLLADTGASWTTLLDRDLRLLDIPPESLEPAQVPIVGIGGSVRSFMLRSVELTFISDEGDFVLQQDLSAVQHELN